MMKKAIKKAMKIIKATVEGSKNAVQRASLGSHFYRRTLDEVEKYEPKASQVGRIRRFIGRLGFMLFHLFSEFSVYFYIYEIVPIWESNWLQRLFFRIERFFCWLEERDPRLKKYHLLIDGVEIEEDLNEYV